MMVINTINELKEKIRFWKDQSKQIGFVATMGYLHEGHLSLVRESKRSSEITVVSIFVNPKQFGPQEDYNFYPRDLNRDRNLLEKEGVDLVFHPSVEEMYPDHYRTYVEVEELQDKLCGKSRPGHFRGVCTVVLKLLNLVQPDEAYFGWKDAQQVVILQKMVKDLNIPTKVVPLPIVRDNDGLALSSRNTYLKPQERQAALVLNKSLDLAARLFSQGVKDASLIKQKMVELISTEPLVRIDYVEIIDLQNLNNIDKLEGDALITLAAYVGRTRLIDNIRFISGGIEK
ncbi:MAG: pantoate--beta-alanine ligase [Acidobacteriota bacterium]|nr:pantoate--beta-alanine ligase [Acidobacteriota bacterium]MDW3229468.1 pantoate--beta-alanine ligase [Acidobacteriota bacterium]